MVDRDIQGDIFIYKLILLKCSEPRDIGILELRLLPREKVRHSTNLMVDTLFILLTTLNTLGKQVAFNLRSRRIDDVINIINGPYFAATKAYHVEVLKENAVVMSRLLTFYHVAIFTCGCMWTVFPIVNRALGEEVQFTGYFPFDTMKSPARNRISLGASALNFRHDKHEIVKYVVVTLNQNTIIYDFLSDAATIYTKIQIRMLRYNMEHLVDFGDTRKMNAPVNKTAYQFTYKDEENEKVELQERFAKEIESIFSEAMVVQFFVMAWVICMTTYKIVGSDFVNQSIYYCDWLCLSPRFRRQLLIMMQCCFQPISPRTAYVIPMSLETYIAHRIFESAALSSSVRCVRRDSRGLRQTIREPESAKPASSVLRTTACGIPFINTRVRERRESCSRLAACSQGWSHAARGPQACARADDIHGRGGAPPRLACATRARPRPPAPARAPPRPPRRLCECRDHTNTPDTCCYRHSLKLHDSPKFVYKLPNKPT
ncbi:unnamed protein product [Chrysodeixis includens]|uniref:Odorant receptor n=1 Tax=Chrysodeixis includens TaxID=689277 RepID=A0A9N8PZU3_CHRIL|nr:unnamed protein product [Chrysodeixis includens]